MEGPEGQGPDGGVTRGRRSGSYLTESPYYVAKYKDGSAWYSVEATGCRDETAARQVLADLERKAELVGSGVMTAAEAASGKPAAPIAEHLDAFDEYHRAKGVTKIHREERGRYLRRLAADSRFGTLATCAAKPWSAGLRRERRKACRPDAKRYLNAMAHVL